MPDRERWFSMGYATLSGPVAVDEERFVVAAGNSAWKQEEKLDSSGLVARHRLDR